MPKPKQQPMRPPTAFERLADPEGRRRAADPNLTVNGAVRANRAAQFMPFAALTGYYELVPASSHAKAAGVSAATIWRIAMMHTQPIAI